MIETNSGNVVRNELSALFVSLELSRKNWLITSLSPGAGEKMSRHSVPGGDVAGLLERFGSLRKKAQARMGKDYPVIVIQEAGLDGFWIHRALEQEGFESHVVEASSIAMSRRHRRLKTDRIDGEMLVRTLLAFKRGEPRVCAMVRPPTPDEEDCRRIARERKVLTAERVQHVNRVKGLLFSQGIVYNPMRRDRRERLEELCTGDGRPLPSHMKSQIIRELDRLDLIRDQIKAVEAERDALIAASQALGSHPLLCWPTLWVSGRNFLPFCGWKDCSANSTIDDRSLPMPGLHRRPGKAGPSIGNRGLANPAMRG